MRIYLIATFFQILIFLAAGSLLLLKHLKDFAGMSIDGELDDHILPHKQNLGVDDAVLMLQKEAGIRK